MLLELVLVAAVLGLVGVAVYQAGHTAAPKAAVTTSPTANSPIGVAQAAAAITETESADDAALSATADATADQVTEADVDVTNLGGSTGADSF